MTYEAVALTEWVGSQVSASVESLLEPATGKALRQLLVQRGVLVFKKLNLTSEQQVHLAGHIGALRDEGDSGIFKITLDQKNKGPANYLKGSFFWHMDGTHDDIPVFGSLLTGVVLSEVGGQTEFANSYAAYEHLPEETKSKIADLKVVHSVEVSMRNAGIEATEENLAFWRSIPDRTHKLVWTHSCGRKSLVIGCHASHVVGMDRQESDALLKELLQWATQPKFVYRHEWDVGDLLIWDNTGVLHRAEPYPEDSGRLMHRTTLVGEEVFS